MISLSAPLQRAIPAAAGLVSLVLAGVIWMPLTRDAPVTLPPSANQQVPDGPDPSAVLQDGAEELLARPLFHMTRRPPVEAAPVAPAPVVVTLSLTGIVNDENDKIALMRLSNQPDLLRLRVGQTVGNWQVEEITDTSVIVASADGERQVISLSSNP